MTFKVKVIFKPLGDLGSNSTLVCMLGRYEDASVHLALVKVTLKYFLTVTLSCSTVLPYPMCVTNLAFKSSIFTFIQ